MIFVEKEINRESFKKLKGIKFNSENSAIFKYDVAGLFLLNESII